jgi:TonB family protein
MEWVALYVPHYREAGPLNLALEGPRFSPPTEDGEPVIVDMRATIPIGEAGYYGVISLTPVSALESRISFMNGNAYELRLVAMEELDQPVRIISEGHPVAFKDETGAVLKGKVVVEFFIDHQGVPRIVHTLEGGDSFLELAARRTVEQFRFNPPRRRGRPAVVKVRMSVRF